MPLEKSTARIKRDYYTQYNWVNNLRLRRPGNPICARQFEGRFLISCGSRKLFNWSKISSVTRNR